MNKKEKINEIYNALSDTKEVCKQLCEDLNETFVTGKQLDLCVGGVNYAWDNFGMGIGNYLENIVFTYISDNLEKYGFTQAHHEYYGGNTWPDYKILLNNGRRLKIDCKSSRKTALKTERDSFEHNGEYFSYCINKNYATKNINDDWNIGRYLKAYNVVVYYKLNDYKGIHNGALEIIHIELIPNVFAMLVSSPVKSKDVIMDRVAFQNFDINGMRRFYNDEMSEETVKQIIQDKYERFQ